MRAPGRARHFTVQGRRVPGLNWDDDAVAELDTASGDVLEDNPSGTYDILDTVRTPWPQGVTPYVVAAAGAHDRVEVRLPDGSTRELDVDEFVELVAADVAGETLAQGTPSCWPSPSPRTPTSTCRASSRTAPDGRCGRTAAR